MLLALCCVSQKAAEEYVKIAEQVAGGVGAILRAVGELPTSGDATATGADPESTAPSDTPRKQVTSAAFLVPVAARMPLPRMRAWLPRLLVAAVTEVGSDLPDVAQSAMTSELQHLDSFCNLVFGCAFGYAPLTLARFPFTCKATLQFSAQVCSPSHWRQL